jgi:hypothetical protein
MAKILRKTAKIFGINAGANQIAEFGSLAAGSPTFTTDPAIIQSLGNYLTGWFGAVIGANSPAIEDMNALCYLFAYQLAYLFQAGVPEWDSGTTYYTGSLVTSGGQIYVSLTDNNLNNALTSAANWRPFVATGLIAAFNPATASPYAMSATVDIGKEFLVNTANGASTFNLPAPTANFWFTIKDIAGSADINPITFHRFGSELFENLAADYQAVAPYGEWTITSDGTNWYITGR